MDEPMGDAIEKLKKKAAEMADGDSGERLPTWKPDKAGDSLAGVLVEGKYVATQYGVSPLIVVESVDDGKKYQLWCSVHVLRSFITDEAPKVGEPILILFNGKKWNEDHTREYNSYTCVTESNDYAHWNASLSEVQQKLRNREQAQAQAANQGPPGAWPNPQPSQAVPQRMDFTPPDESPF